MVRPLSRFVQRLELRNILSDEDRDALLAIDANRSQKPARWDLVRPGDEVDYACLVDQGIVARAEQFADGRRNTTVIYVPGDMADLHSVALPRAAWAITALTDCAVYKVPHVSLKRLFRDHPAIATALWRDTVVDASILSKWVSVLSRHTADRRLAHLLCEYGYRMAAAGLGRREDFDLPLTQAQLAELLGVTEVHVQRTFRTLRDKGIIEGERRTIRILDLGKLERIAEFDARYLMLDMSGHHP